MKKIILGLSAHIIILTCAAQPYGQVSYPFAAGLVPSSAFHALANTNEGFVLSSKKVLTTTGNANFVITRTSPGGEMLGSSWEFQREYLTYGDMSCSNAPWQILDLGGVSVIQSTIAGSAQMYAVSGANSHGVFFSLLDASGIPIQNTMYTYPGGLSTADNKPQLIESTINPGTYFIVGTYGGGVNFYALHVAASGGIINQMNRTCSPSIWVSDILESPYAGNPIAIVGAQNGTGPTVQDALFFAINQGLTGITALYTYDRNNQNDYLQSIEVANCPIGGTGFVVGGYAEGSPLVLGKSLAMKIQPTGIPIWSSILEGVTDPTIGKVKQVLERQNTLSFWEYYVLSDITQGMVVYKLDDSGNPFGTTYPGNPDEFIISTAGAHPLDMSLNSDIARPDVGLHIFGQDFPTASSYNFTESYFNGEMGCNVTTNFVNVDPNLTGVSTFIASNSSNLVSCSSFYLTSATTSAYAPICGPFPSIGTGSNARTVGIAENSENSNFIVIESDYQRQETKIKFSQQNTAGILKIIAVDGKIVQQIRVKPTDETILLNNAEFIPGMYSAALYSEQGVKVAKILIVGQ